MSPSLRRLVPLACVTLGTAITAPALHAQHGNARTSGPSIPQVARTAGQFATLLAAVEAAGLTETLLGRGPFTLFAPTDEAFRRLPSGTVDDLLKPQNREKLKTILTYHVVSGRVLASQARTLSSAATVAGPRVQISEQNGDLRINDATVRIADIPASNGVIHVIDRVLLPTEPARSASVTGASESALGLLDAAIDRGVPLFNDGQPAATVAIYEVAVTGLLALGDDVPSDARRTLRNVLRAANGADARDRAWTLRRALDETRSQLTGRMSNTR
jgi:transforming growth factor-beta-induced protein